MAAVIFNKSLIIFLAYTQFTPPPPTFTNATLGHGLLCSVTRHVQHLQDCTGLIISNCFDFPEPQFRVKRAVSLSKELTCPDGHMPTRRYGHW